ncbi:hypothetical protein BV22DRAFT_1018795 [Leucogyrophana mollusca]|uniref:Uncharacterized protein n=1 Tax=Leucogyrophana mollusca TaxID=85980 RepID=A0ACB8B7L7_9AGAM|nr:hypothetical protein BV22DRAFT_1018795 [Leucogyrophana mollusca]
MGSPLLLSPLVTGTPPSLPPSTPSSLPDIRGLPSIAPTPTSGSLPTSPAVLSLGIGHNPPHQLSQQQLPAPRPLSRHFILPEWTSTQQKRFERRISRLTASAGLPFAWVDNPEWIALCDEFIPGAKIPSQRTLARRLIPEAVCELRAGVKEVVRGRETTVQADGWTGINNHHLIAFMVMADRKVYTVRVHDASMERKTAENLLYLLEDVLKTVEQEWGGVIVAVVTDASGESRKARRLLGEKHPSLVVLDCYAHQVGFFTFSLDSRTDHHTCHIRSI